MVRVEERNSWSDIPGDLLKEILRKLTLVDYLKCRRVCRSWRRTVDDAVATKGTCLPAPQFPFLMLLPPNLYRHSKPASLLDLTQDISYTIPTQTWKGYFEFDRVFAVQGWLVFQRIYYILNYDLIMFSNPVSGEEFELPRLPLFPGRYLNEKVSVKLVFSSSAVNSSDFLVVACATIQLAQDKCMQQLAFCKVADKSWILIPTDESGSFVYDVFDEFGIHDWKLYAMSTCWPFSVTLFNLKDSNIIASEKLELEIIPRRQRIGQIINYMLATDGDDILLVAHIFEGETCFPIIPTVGFRIFKLDICGHRWIEVNDLGDRVLAIDCVGIQFISAKEINLPRGNCVFFCIVNKLRDPFVKCELGVFALEDKRITHFPLSNSLQFFGRCVWFMPSLW